MTTESKVTENEADITLMGIPDKEPVSDYVDQQINDCMVLDPIHRRLIQELPHLAKIANIPPQMIYQSAMDYVSKREGTAFTALRTLLNGPMEKRRSGFWYNRKLTLEERKNATVLIRMQVLTAVCLRNFIDGRVMTGQQCVKSMVDDTMPEPTVLFIPAFFEAGKELNKGHKFQADRLTELLLQRQAANLFTCIDIPEKDYALFDLFSDTVLDVLSTYIRFDPEV